MFAILSQPIVILLLSQLVFTGTDLLGRFWMTKSGTFVENISKPWIILFVVGHIVASIAQLYVFSKFEVGKTVALFGAVSIMMATGFGFLLLQETLTVNGYIGVMIAVTAFLVLAVR